MKNERLLVFILLLLLISLLNCGGGFEEESLGAKDFSQSIFGPDSL